MTSIVSPNIRVRCPEHFEVGEHSIVDDFCYFSVRVKIGRWSHIASGCSVAGGAARSFTLGDYSSLSSGTKIWCASDNFAEDVVAIVPSGIKKNLIEGDVILGDYTAVGSNSVVMPGSVVHEGAVIGALSFVPAFSVLEPWTVYAGNPVRRLRARNRESVLAQVAEIR